MIEGIVGEYGVSGTNENGERLLEMCSEDWLVFGTSLFRKKYVYKYMWVGMVEGRVSNRGLMDYVLVPKRMLGRLLDVNVCRGEGGK